MRLFYTVLFLVYVVALTSAAISADAPAVRTYGSYSRLVLPLPRSAQFKIQSASQEAVVLQIDRMKMPEWGDLDLLTDKRVKAVRAQTSGLDQVAVEIKLAASGIDYFAYTQADPPAVVVDFWPQKELAQQDVNIGTVATPQGRGVQRAPAAKLPKRAAAAEEIANPLRLDRDFFQRYPQPHPEFQFKGEIFALPGGKDPSRDWSWTKLGEGRPEAESYSLAKALFQAKKFGLAIKTCEVIERDFSASDLLPEISFLKAMAYKRLGEANKNQELQDLAEREFQVLMERRAADGSQYPFAKHIRTYFAEKAYGEKNWLGAAEILEGLIKETPESSADFAGYSMALADAYFHVGQERRAERLYRYIAQQNPKKIVAKEALYRVGDILAFEKNYARAAEELEAAMARYPEYRTKRPEAQFNLAESYFWLKQYGRATEAFERFLRDHPANTLGAVAHVRLGEVEELNGKKIAAARKRYENAINAFPYTEGARVASLRQARLDLPREKDLSYPIKALEEVYRDEKAERSLRQIAQTALIEHLLASRSPDRAIELAQAGLSTTVSTEFELFRGYYIRAIAAKLGQLVNQAKYADALALYESEKKWFGLAGADIYRYMAEAYRGLRLFAESNRFMALYATERKKELGKRGLASLGAEAQDIRLARAKNSFAEGKFGEALTSLTGISAGTDADVERMRAISLFRLGRVEESFSSAERALRIYADNKDKIDAKVFQERASELGDILIERAHRARDFRSMQQTADRMLGLLPKREERFVFLRADSLWYQKRHADAVTAYQKAEEEFPKSDRIDRAHYNTGMSYLAQGKREQAVKVLTALRDKSQNVWSQSAKQELELIQWEQKYSTVLKSLPPSGLGIVN